MLWHATSPLLALACLLLAIGTAWLIQLFAQKPLSHSSYASIDGLRGYLAFSVFLHHASIWYFYTHQGKWSLPSSHLFTHFGQSSVSLFFMITSFLFFSKLLNAKKSGIDWGFLIVSRIFRIVPLYLLAMAILFGLTAFATNFQLHEPKGKIIKSLVQWLAFTITSAPDINGLENTYLIIAGVTWSLPYEWLLYASLPVFGLLLGLRPSAFYLGLAVALTLSIILLLEPQRVVLQTFIGGIVAAFAVRIKPLQQFAMNPLASFITLACLFGTIVFYPEVYSVAPTFLLSIAFILIAAGCDLFGLLRLQVSRTLGEMAYSIYLLHGFILFITFHLVIGLDKAARLTPQQHWMLIALLSCVVILISFLTFKTIEEPCMAMAKKFKPRRPPPSAAFCSLVQADKTR